MEPVTLYQKVSNAEMRLDYCEYCGSTPGNYETHHIKTKGSGGPEIRANKINLGVGCGCHALAQEYKIKPHQLIIIVARRENVSVVEVYQAIGWPVPDNIEELEQLARNDFEETPRTMEDLISLLITTKEEERERRFVQGQLIDLILQRSSEKKSKTVNWISSQTGWSPAHIRSLHKTFLAFPEESTRVPTLDWSHHKIAAATEQPKYWIERAAGKDDNGNETGKEMSTRELRTAIIEKDLEEGKIPNEDPVDELSMKRAKKVLENVSLIIDQGGAAATWLLQELQKICLEYHVVEEKAI